MARIDSVPGRSTPDRHARLTHLARSRTPLMTRTLLMMAGVLVVLVAGLLAARMLAERAALAGIEVVAGQPLHADSTTLGVIQATAPPDAAGGTARVALSSDFYDFGSVNAHAVVQHDFLVINRGSTPLVIQRAYTTCGCETAVISAGVIPPGKAGRATLIFDAGFHPAAGQTVRRGLIIETNDPERPQVEIWVQVRVVGN